MMKNWKVFLLMILTVAWPVAIQAGTTNFSDLGADAITADSLSADHVAAGTLTTNHLTVGYGKETRLLWYGTVTVVGASTEKVQAVTSARLGDVILVSSSQIKDVTFAGDVGSGTIAVRLNPAQGTATPLSFNCAVFGYADTPTPTNTPSGS